MSLCNSCYPVLQERRLRQGTEVAKSHFLTSSCSYFGCQLRPGIAKVRMVFVWLLSYQEMGRQSKCRCSLGTHEICFSVVKEGREVDNSGLRLPFMIKV